MRVQVLESIYNLHGIALDLQLVQSLPPFEELIHALVMAKFEQNVNIVTILKEMHKLRYIDMLNRPMNLDLAHQLLLGSAPL